MKIFLQSWGFLLCFLSFLLPLLSSCRSSQLRQQSSPRPGQLNWGDEAVLQGAVRRLLDSSRLASREPGVAGRYADLLRHWYQAASGNGQDVDSGVRMLNYLRNIHLQYGGEKSLWEQAVQLARQAGISPEGMPVPPIPLEFK